MKTLNYYDLLGVSPDASDKEIRDAYLAMAKLVHPDRFDPTSQPKEWAKANQLFQQLNAAYEVLRDPVRRAAFDQQEQRNDNGHEQAKGKSSKGSHDFRPGLDGQGVWHCFSELPGRTQERIIKTLAENGNQVVWKLGAYRYVAYIILSLAAVSFGLFKTNDYLWSETTRSVFYGTVAFASVLIWWSVGQLRALKGSRVPPSIFLTPLYLVRTRFDEVMYVFLWNMTDFKATHNYKNGSYSYTAFELSFESGAEDFNVKSKAQADSLLQFLNKCESEFKGAVKANNLNKLFHLDDFANTAGNPSRLTPWYRMNYGVLSFFVLLTVGTVACVGSNYANAYFDDKLWWNDSVRANTATAFRQYKQTHPSGRWLGEADSRIEGLYYKALAAYESVAKDKADAEAFTALRQLLVSARTTGKYSVPVYFEGESRIPVGIEERLAWENGVNNVLQIGDSFSAAKLRGRENTALEAIRKAFSSVIPGDLLTYSQTTSLNDAKVVIRYTVSTSRSLYYLDSESYKDERVRPYYPGIKYQWKGSVFAPEQEIVGFESSPQFSFRMQSSPASSFVYHGGNVYDDMSASAYEDFVNVFVSKFGVE